MSDYLARICAPLLLACVSWSSGAGAQNAVLPRAAAVPGGVLTMPVAGAQDERPVVTFNDAQVMVLRQPAGWVAVVGVNLDAAPGEFAIEVKPPGDEPRRIPFTVGPKQYRTQKLKVAP